MFIPMLSVLRKSRFPIKVPLFTVISSHRTDFLNFEGARRCSSSELKDVDFDFEGLNSNQFGNVEKKYGVKVRSKTAENIPDDKDNFDKLEIKRGNKRSPNVYRRILQEYIKNKLFNYPAILKLHHEHIYEDRYIPERIWYTMMFRACARAGDAQKAQDLLEEMTRYNMKPTKAAVTEIINSSANQHGSKEDN